MLWTWHSWNICIIHDIYFWYNRQNVILYFWTIQMWLMLLWTEQNLIFILQYYFFLFSEFIVNFFHYRLNWIFVGVYYCCTIEVIILSLFRSVQYYDFAIIFFISVKIKQEEDFVTFLVCFVMLSLQRIIYVWGREN